MFEQLIATGHFWHPTCWLDVLNVGWLQLFPHQSVKRLRGEAGERAGWECETVICCAYGHE